VKVRALDDALTNEDMKSLAANAPATEKQLQTFFELLQDVPDEL
jgi:hypothetical protein